MKKLLLLLLAPLCFSQTSNTVTRQFPGVPTGSCSFLQLGLNKANGDFYDCFGGVWLKVTGAGGGSGTVTNVSFTGGLISVSTPTTTPALTVAGTSGGIPYFSGATTWASSGALTVNGVVLGGGSGNPPTVTSADSTTTHALFATAGAPAFRRPVCADLSDSSSGCSTASTGLNNTGDTWFIAFGPSPPIGSANGNMLQAVSGTGGNNSANTIEYRRIWFPGGVVNNITYQLTVAQTTGTGHWMWGLYNSSGTLVLSTGQLGISGGVACSSPAFASAQAFTVTSGSTNCGTASVGIGTNIASGYYWEATTADTVTPQFEAIIQSTNLLGSSQIVQTPTTLWGKLGSGSSNGILPASGAVLPPAALDTLGLPLIRLDR